MLRKAVQINEDKISVDIDKYNRDQQYRLEVGDIQCYERLDVDPFQRLNQDIVSNLDSYQDLANQLDMMIDDDSPEEPDNFEGLLNIGGWVQQGALQLYQAFRGVLRFDQDKERALVTSA